MRALFIGAGSPAIVFGLVPLANALRSGGHEVFMAANEPMMPSVSGNGIPAVSMAEHDIWHYVWTDRNGDPRTFVKGFEEEMRFTGGWFAHLGAEGYATLRAFTGQWRPDIVVGGTMCYAAPLIAARLGVPYVRVAWDSGDWRWTDEGALPVLEPELRELGLDRIPEPDLRIEIYPPSLTPPDAFPDAQLMRWTPGNLQRKAEPWMYSRPERPRVCLTAGSRASRERSLEFLRGLAERIAPLDVEIVIPAPEELASELRRVLPGVRTGWLPLDVVVPTCDLVVHHAGGATTMTAMSAGVPQLVVSETLAFLPPVRRLADYGAAISLAPDDATDEAVATACRELLSEPSYRERAGALARELAELPPPSEFVPQLEKLAAR
ncbi:nucleotide disphospho-sugar-binding domain-containing protein [Streptomyces barkulensis]|uniref:nucleotide disphospho-sugar-binding domain-containing protein n=1 Tax=Streptomyces barkulensis TaxID=1257026 RepID=UPI000C6EAB07|nr:nucleotide disphospho-sugar-binding domain-containing protein [Streptomyces barkulensis]